MKGKQFNGCFGSRLTRVNDSLYAWGRLQWGLVCRNIFAFQSLLLPFCGEGVRFAFQDPSIFLKQPQAGTESMSASMAEEPN